MDPATDCPQFQVSEVMKLADKLMKTKVAAASSFPGRSLFGTTLDSQGLDKVVPERHSSDTSKCHCQPESPMVQGTERDCKSRPVHTPKPDRLCHDSVRSTSSKTGSARDGTATPCGGLAKEGASPLPPKKPPKSQTVSPVRSLEGSATSVQGEKPASQSPMCDTPDRPPSRDQQCLIPRNIEHKFRTHVVNEVLSDEKVKEFLYNKEHPAGTVDAKDTTVEAAKNVIDEANMYEQIGFPLRCNIFPGYSGSWKSEAHSTYTKEVFDRYRRDPKHWHGRTSDDLSARSDTPLARHMLPRNLQLYAGEQPKYTRACPQLSKPRVKAGTERPGQTTARKTAAAEPPTAVPKTNRPDANPEAALFLERDEGNKTTHTHRDQKKDETFWDFYDQSLESV